MDSDQLEFKNLKAYIVIAVAMEVEGRLTAVKVEKAFNTRELAQKYMDCQQLIQIESNYLNNLLIVYVNAMSMK